MESEIRNRDSYSQPTKQTGPSWLKGKQVKRTLCRKRNKSVERARNFPSPISYPFSPLPIVHTAPQQQPQPRRNSTRPRLLERPALDAHRKSRLSVSPQLQHTSYPYRLQPFFLLTQQPAHHHGPLCRSVLQMRQPPVPNGTRRQPDPPPLRALSSGTVLLCRLSESLLARPEEGMPASQLHHRVPPRPRAPEHIKDPSVKRTLSCPAESTFEELHMALQDAFGLASTHSYDFAVVDPSFDLSKFDVVQIMQNRMAMSQPGAPT